MHRNTSSGSGSGARSTIALQHIARIAGFHQIRLKRNVATISLPWPAGNWSWYFTENVVQPSAAVPVCSRSIMAAMVTDGWWSE
jgi:hypothetical protein